MIICLLPAACFVAVVIATLPPDSINTLTRNTTPAHTCTHVHTHTNTHTNAEMVVIAALNGQKRRQQILAAILWHLPGDKAKAVWSGL